MSKFVKGFVITLVCMFALLTSYMYGKYDHYKDTNNETKLSNTEIVQTYCNADNYELVAYYGIVTDQDGDEAFNYTCVDVNGNKYHCVTKVNHAEYIANSIYDTVNLYD